LKAEASGTSKKSSGSIVNRLSSMRLERGVLVADLGSFQGWG